MNVRRYAYLGFTMMLAGLLIALVYNIILPGIPPSGYVKYLALMIAGTGCILVSVSIIIQGARQYNELKGKIINTSNSDPTIEEIKWQKGRPSDKYGWFIVALEYKGQNLPDYYLTIIVWANMDRYWTVAGTNNMKVELSDSEAERIVAYAPQPKFKN